MLDTGASVHLCGGGIVGERTVMEQAIHLETANG